MYSRQILLVWSNQRERWDEYVGEENCIQNFGGEVMGRANLEMRKILKWMWGCALDSVGSGQISVTEACKFGN